MQKIIIAFAVVVVRELAEYTVDWFTGEEDDDQEDDDQEDDDQDDDDQDDDE